MTAIPGPGKLVTPFMNGENDGGQVFDADVALKTVRLEEDQLDLISRSGRPAPAPPPSSQTSTLIDAVDPVGLEDTRIPEPADTLRPEPLAETRDITETVDDLRIPPNQTFFKIGEVAEIVGVKPYVLRYWENEFSWVKPEKTSSRQRRYRRQDVALLLQIRRLRHDEQLTVARTRELIRESRRRGAPVGLPSSLSASPVDQDRLPPRAHHALREMRTVLEGLLEAAQED